MDLVTTFRGLDRPESGLASRILERSTARLERLLDGPTTLKVVVDKQGEYRITLSMSMRGTDLTSEDSGHDLANVIASACERLRGQMVRARHRKESQRHRPVRRGDEPATA